MNCWAIFSLLLQVILVLACECIPLSRPPSPICVCVCFSNKKIFKLQTPTSICIDQEAFSWGFSVKLAILWICNLTVQAHPFPLWLFFHHHHLLLLLLLLLLRDGNSMYFLVLEVRIPAKHLQTIYILVWNKNDYLFLGTMKNLSREHSLPQNSWKQ